VRKSCGLRSSGTTSPNGWPDPTSWALTPRRLSWSPPARDKPAAEDPVAETGYDSCRLFLRTRINASENQARRLLNDRAAFRARLEQNGAVGTTAATRYCIDQVLSAVPGQPDETTAA
jgi:Domain of unknown function (DUF4032)